MTHVPEDLPSAGLPQPKRVEVTAAWLAETVEKQRAYRDRRRLSTAAWHGPAASPTAVRSSSGRQVHDPRQPRLL